MAEPGRNFLLNHAEKGYFTQRLPGAVPLAVTLQRFIARYNTTAAPFNWKYTAADLGRHLARIDSIRLASITGPAAAPATLKAA